MHRTVTISLPSSDSKILCEKLAALETVIGISLSKKVSIKPPGDVITINVLNKGADDALSIIRSVSEKHEVSITTSEAASFIDPRNSETIEDDVDEAILEEMETGLRHQGRITWNFVFLMALGGAICAVGLVTESTTQALAFAAAGIIAPGFEPLAKIPLGIVLGQWKIVRHGLISSFVGYAISIASAALMMFVLLRTGSAEAIELVGNSQIESIAQPTLKEFIVSGAAALAGIIISAYRRSVIAGALIGVILTQAAASIGAGFAAGEMGITRNGFERFGTDVFFVTAAGLIVFWLKQVLVHRRKPLV